MALVGLTLLLLLLLLRLLLGSDAVLGATRYGRRESHELLQRNVGDPSAYYRACDQENKLARKISFYQGERNARENCVRPTRPGESSRTPPIQDTRRRNPCFGNSAAGKAGVSRCART
jgi:hypothetical protein